MIDDSLDDVHKERKKMVEELKFEHTCLTRMRVNCSGDYIVMTIENNSRQELTNILDRSQAEELMIYLQDHLGYVGVDKDLAQKDDAFD